MNDIIDLETALEVKDQLIKLVKTYKHNGEKYFEIADVVDIIEAFEILKKNDKRDTDAKVELYADALERIQFYACEVAE